MPARIFNAKSPLKSTLPLVICDTQFQFLWETYSFTGTFALFVRDATWAQLIKIHLGCGKLKKHLAWLYSGNLSDPMVTNSCQNEEGVKMISSVKLKCTLWDYKDTYCHDVRSQLHNKKIYINDIRWFSQQGRKCLAFSGIQTQGFRSIAWSWTTWATSLATDPFSDIFIPLVRDLLTCLWCLRWCWCCCFPSPIIQI